MLRSQRGAISQSAPKCWARVRWVAVGAEIGFLRQVKELGEIGTCARPRCWRVMFFAKRLRLLKPGACAKSKIAAEIEYLMRSRGASGPAFGTIVAFGARSAHPHARPTEKRLRKNELVVLDLGVILGHYCSDITRTVFVGRAPARIGDGIARSRRRKRLRVAAARAGITCGDVDAAARGVLAHYRLDNILCTAPDMGLAWKCMRSPGWRVDRDILWFPETSLRLNLEFTAWRRRNSHEDDVAIHAGRTEVLTQVPRNLIEI